MSKTQQRLQNKLLGHDLLFAHNSHISTEMSWKDCYGILLRIRMHIELLYVHNHVLDGKIDHGKHIAAITFLLTLHCNYGYKYKKIK